jgi:Fe-S-cluster containining protein
MDTQAFYQCQRCGNCCRWPGTVKLTLEDIERMADFLKISPEEATETFTEIHPSRQWLVLKNRPAGECIFLEGINTCRIQKVKPIQCQGFPNKWNFPGWREVCEAIEVKSSIS